MSHPLPTKSLKKQIESSIHNRPDDPLPYKTNTRKTIRARDLRASEWQDYEERRKQATERRQEAIENLHLLHKQLKSRWQERGIDLHEASTAEDACRIITGIIQSTGADRVLKSKTMLGEEIGLANYLERRGITPIETDLGEYIVQLRGEAPSHITMPAMHLTREDVGELFAERLGAPYTSNPSELTKIARQTLRREFLGAKVGLCGVNFAVAETGHLATVTNEGNGRMVTTLPRIVIALMGWERVTQSLEDLGLLWQLLARSATGQRATVYLNLLAGPSPGPTGPDEVHVVIVDNGRKRIYQDVELREVLRCIRCGACLNVCPVYQQVGGHPYGGTYPGPIGAVLTPLLEGLEKAPDHPFASSLCGACEEICPVSIPLPRMLLLLRRRIIEQTKEKSTEAKAWDAFQWMMSRPERYEHLGKLARAAQRFLPLNRIPEPWWSKDRDTPIFAAKSFRELFNEKQHMENKKNRKNI